jgi:hypothetical protein
MIAIGDPVVLWLSVPAAGILAAGTVTDVPREGRGQSVYWVDADEKRKMRPYLPVRLFPIPRISKRDLVSDPRFAGAEVIRAPRVGNPSFLTNDEFQSVLEQMDTNTIRRIGWQTSY